MRQFRDLPIKRKLLFVILLASGSAMLLSAALVGVSEMRMLYRAGVDNLAVLADTLARNGSAALEQLDRGSAEAVLSALNADPDIALGVMLDSEKRLFAYYSKPGRNLPVAFSGDDGAQLVQLPHGFAVDLYHPIQADGRRLGTLFLRSQLGRLKTLMIAQTGILAFGLLAAFGILLLLSTRLQRHIVEPVERLAESARRISRHADYSIRVERGGGDEVGQLIDSFNAMLDVIQAHQQHLLGHREQLEEQVRQRTLDLSESRDQALQAARAKSEFLANMSHEIRTPLNGVMGMLALLKDAPLDERHAGFLHTASRSADSLLSLINDILDFSRIEAGKLTVEDIAFNVHNLCEEVASLYLETAGRKHLRLTCQVDPGVPRDIMGDPTRLRQVLGNLLSNAVKFTGQGTVTLQVSLSGDRNIRFEVRDTGIGISPLDQQRLFESFTQADSSMTRRHGGTGLGLSVCRALVELLGGRLEVRSRPGQGSSFHFELLHRPVSLHAAPQADSATPNASHRFRGRVLVVDDEPMNRHVAQGMLNKFGLEPDLADSGQDALALLSEHRYDLVLMDCQMPDMSGYEVVDTLRRWEIGHADGTRLPVIAVTANALQGAREQALAAGLDEYLCKPFSPEDLADHLRRWLPAEVEDAATEAGTCAHEQAGLWDRERILRTVGGDRKLLAEIIGLFRQRLPSALEQIEQALGNGDAPALEASAHALKGLLGHFAADRLTDLAQQLEDLGRAGKLDNAHELGRQLSEDSQRLSEALY